MLGRRANKERHKQGSVGYKIMEEKEKEPKIVQNLPRTANSRLNVKIVKLQVIFKKSILARGLPDKIGCKVVVKILEE